MARSCTDVIELSDDSSDSERVATPHVTDVSVSASLDLADGSPPTVAATATPPSLMDMKDEQQHSLASSTDELLQPSAAAIKHEPEPPHTPELLELKVEPGLPLPPPPPIVAAATPAANTVMIMGYTVDFPEGKRPFPAQLAVMNKVLTALKTSQHALLESPTGSGKTLALLCSALTFQRRHVAELIQAQKEQRVLIAAALAAKKKQVDALNQQRAAAEYARVNGSGPVDAGVSEGIGEHISESISANIRATNGAMDDDDFASTQPSFETIRLSVAAAAATTSTLTDDGWISMASKKVAMRLERLDDEDDDDDDEDFDIQVSQTQPQSQPQSQTQSSKRSRALPTSFAASARTGDTSGTNTSINDDDDDIESPPELKKLKSRRRLPQSFSDAAVDAILRGDRNVKLEGFHSTADTNDTNDDTTNSNDGRTKPKRVVPPKIFFCSRTHSQLSQSVDELKNCPVSYLAPLDPTHPFIKDLRMTVLGSKANYCVNKRVNRDASAIDDKCKTLMDAGGCSFAIKRRKTNDLRRAAPPVWDIEDLVALAKRHRECAYFHARDALETAHIVFCPYNYILDPSIRSAVAVDLKNAIVIFDEAHNVEDTCRASASVELTADVLALASKAFMAVIKLGARPPTYVSLLKVLNGLHRWLTHVAAALKPSGFEEESKVWPGPDALAMLAEFAGLTPETFPDVMSDLHAVEAMEKELSASGDHSGAMANGDDGTGTDDNDRDVEGLERANPKMLLGAMPLNTVRSVLLVVNYMLREQSKYVDDFRLVARKTYVAGSNFGTNTKNRFRGSSGSSSGSWELKLCIWCLNAAVAFSDVAKLARSVILTSGTLSPMDSFAGELGAEFPIRLEANHVVNMHKQVFAGAIMRGPGGVDLSSTFRNQQAFQYQDALGQLLLQYALVVPGGVLMFLPSYSLLSKLETRWRQTGLWAKIDAVKTVFTEPRKAGKDFDKLLDDYKFAVAAGRAGTAAGGRTGAVFLAVYRGKVSEGIDFSNDNARAVLAVGIPFPSVKELQVVLKREYQDIQSRVDKTRVNGHTWYSLQAFRALNQALGRCIRHRLDYGAILLLDSRHRGHVHAKSLSKWMRPFLHEVEHSEHVVAHFEQFFARNERELGTGVALAPSVPASDTETVALKYETSGTASAPPVDSLESTMHSVRAFLENKRRLEETPRVFSLFMQGKPRADTSAKREPGSGRGRGRGRGGRGDSAQDDR